MTGKPACGSMRLSVALTWPGTVGLLFCTLLHIHRWGRCWRWLPSQCPVRCLLFGAVHHKRHVTRKLITAAIHQGFNPNDWS